MDPDKVIIDSPLSQEVTRDGVTVKIQIYRLEDENRWALEVEDEEGGSTVWDEEFSTDTEALKEAMKTIDEDGIKSFFDDPKKGFH